jgi:threonine dehydrogenase-like Zn-dependent dehydrogenase
LALETRRSALTALRYFACPTTYRTTSPCSPNRSASPSTGRGFLAGGFDRVYDCAGSQQSIDDALRITRGAGTIVMVGAAGMLPKLDWTFVWNKELKIEGTVFYGHEDWKGGCARTFETALELLASTEAPLAQLVTHRIPLEAYAQAIEVNLDRRAHKSVKAVFAI